MKMNTDELCSICGEGRVMNHVDQLESEYRGKTALVPMHYKTCNVCGSDFAGGDESRLNKRAILAFRKSVDGLLTGSEICALRERYEINQKQASRLFGGGPVAFSKYENDDVAHSESMDKLLRLVLKSEHAFWSLAEQAGMTAELAPKVPKQVNGIRPVYKTMSRNVISVQFRNDDSMQTRISARRLYQPTTGINEALRWKR
jgi:HTH-type transcriptional regulator/antitoxin MqsA